MDTWKTENTKALTILRISSHRQKDNSSHGIQEEEVREYCIEHGLQLVHIAKIVESAKDSDDRKQYKAAISFALKRKIRHILFYMNDREARNLTDSEYNEKLVKRGLVVIHYVRDKKIIHLGSSESDFMLRDFQAIQNKSFSRNLSVKVNDAMKKKAETGWFPGNHPPLGYVHQKMRNEDGKELKRGTIIVPDTDEKRLSWVKREFELRAKGWSYEKIRRQIIADGFIAPARQSGYSTGTIEQRLKNIFYRGQFEWQATVYKGKHELIVSREILRAVDETFGDRQPYRRITQTKGAFTAGWLKCAECGCSVVYDPKSKKIKGTGEVRIFHYYHCTNGKRSHTTMKGMTVTEEALWESFKETFDRVSITDEFAKDIALALNEAHLKRQDAHRKELEGFERALKNLDQKTDGIFDLFASKAVDEDQYRRQNERIKEERFQILNLMGDARKAIEGAYLETAKSILELATSAKTLWLLRAPQERREFLEIVLSNRVLNVRSVQYDFRKAFETLSKMSGKSEWRPLRDSNSCLLRERELS